MKRYVLGLLAALALFVAPAARAGTTVMQVSYSSFTVGGLAISSAPATSVIGTAGQAWRQVCVQNWDTANALYCGETVSVSSTTNVSTALLGNLVPPAVDATHPSTPMCFIIVEGMDYFCRTGKTTGSSTSVITKAK